MKIYTRTGDDGTTGLLYGGRVPKDSAQPTAYGSVDEAQSAIGVARAEASDPELAELLLSLERDLWVLMAELATDPDNRHKLVGDKSLVTDDMVERLEHLIDDISERFEPPTEFVVPGENVWSCAPRRGPHSRPPCRARCLARGRSGQRSRPLPQSIVRPALDVGPVAGGRVPPDPLGRVELTQEFRWPH